MSNYFDFVNEALILKLTAYEAMLEKNRASTSIEHLGRAKCKP